MSKTRTPHKSDSTASHTDLFIQLLDPAQYGKHHGLVTSSMVLDYLAKTKENENADNHKELANITTCQDLGYILAKSDQHKRQRLYKALGTRLYDIVNDIFDMRDIREEFHREVFQQLGLKYVAGLINCAYYLIQTLSTLPEHERLPLIQLVGLDKVRSFIHDKNNIQQFFSVMPTDTHDLLRATLFLYDIKINCIGSESSLAQENKNVEEMDLSQSTTKYGRIVNPIKISDEIVIGNAFVKENPWKPTVVVYNIAQDNIESELESDEFFDLIQLIDEEKKIFVVHEWRTNCYYQLSWINEKLVHTGTAYAKWHSPPDSYEGESFNDAILLPDGKWMILSQEINNVINIYKGWYIDILDPETFTLSRKLNVHKDQYEFMEHLTLMPDGKTVMTWSDCTVKSSDENCCLTTYSICLFNTDDYSVQRIILPIDPRDFTGHIKQIHVVDNKIEIEISVHHGNRYSDPTTSLFYSFEYRDLRLRARPEQELAPRTDTSGKKNPFSFFGENAKDSLSPQECVNDTAKKSGLDH